MSKIIILPNLNLCPKGKLIKKNFLDNNLCDILLNNDINILHICEKFGKCGTCYVIIKEGNTLNNIDFDESETLNKLSNLKENFRLSCKLFIKNKSNIIINIPS